MKMTPSGLLALTFFEGEILHMYLDSGGTPTVCVGHTAAAGPPAPVPGMTMTHEQCQVLLAKDLTQYENEVNAHLAKLGAKTVADHVFDGMVSFCYNLGPGNFDKASWVTSWVRGNMVASEAQLKQWDRVNGQVSPGLARRRAEEADMIFRDKYPNHIASPTVSAPPATATTVVMPTTAAKPDPTSQQQSHADLLSWIEEMFPSLAAWIGKL